MTSLTPAQARFVWVEALRSGEFKQTKDALRTEDGHCCLGVACDKAVEYGVIPPPRKGGDAYHYGADEESVCLPAEVVTWLGLDAPELDVNPHDPEVAIGEDFRPLSSHNDVLGRPFDVLADAIEQNFGTEQPPATN